MHPQHTRSPVRPLARWGTAAAVATVGALVVAGALAPGSAAVAERIVQPVAETDPFPIGGGDVADDSAIWRDAADPTRSVIVAGSKSASSGGIATYDLQGRLLQWLPGGRIGNVDLRDDVRLGDRTVVLVGANERRTNTLRFWTLDPTTRTLTPVTGPTGPTVRPNYGFCLYRSPVTATLYAFVSQDGGPLLEQYALGAGPGGAVTATLVRTLTVGQKPTSQSEGCVADDERGLLYVGEEDVAVWRYGAEPDAGTTRVAVDTAGGGRLVKDIEGLALTYGPAGSGLLLVSSQGDSTIAVYRRDGDNEFVTSVAVGANGPIDAVTKTDGVAAHAGDFGGPFAGGLVVVHDELNTGATVSNLKLVPLASITRTDLPRTLTLPAVADTYLDANQPGRAFGAATRLRQSGLRYTTLLRFDTRRIPAGATVQSVVLEPYAPSSAPACSYRVHRVGNDWTEATTASTAPPVGPELAGSDPLVAKQRMPVTLPVDALGGGTEVSFAVRGPVGCSSGAMSSRETVNGPRLLVTVVGPVATG